MSLSYVDRLFLLILSFFMSLAPLAAQEINLETSRQYFETLDTQNKNNQTPNIQDQKNPSPQPNSATQGFTQNQIVIEVSKFLGASAETVAELVDRAFRSYGAPDAVIRGDELNIAAIIGVRYGRGNIQLANGETHDIYWRGPSVGFDAGGNASKSFTLVYGLNSPDEIYYRFSGVDASAYYIGGLSMNYLQRDNITLVPIRVGFGLKLGASLGYLKFDREASWLPF